MTSDQNPSGMAEATRLVREGRLHEATALVQRTLGGITTSPETSGEEPMETTAPVLPPRAASV